MTSGYPTDPNSHVVASDWAGRELREISFHSDLRIGQFRAFDFFGDGSFYLLDTPGHAIGHMSALCRTTVECDGSFLFLGGDCCHHGAEFRPTEYLPLPAKISPSPFTAYKPHSKCPGELFQRLHPEKSATEPFVKIAHAEDVNLATDSVRGVEEFDAAEILFVLLAHDHSLLGLLGFFPKEFNGWRETGVKRRGTWGFLADFKEVVEDVNDMKT